MDKYVSSSDGARVHYQITGTGNTALIFVHGWLGNAKWWSKQEQYLSDKYTVVLVDLPGHGLSDKTRKEWSSAQYAQDIKSVADGLSCEKIILVGHSMSGPYVLEASLQIPKVSACILVDTVKDLNQVISYEQAQQFMFSQYKKDFRFAVENIMPQYLFSRSTPSAVREQLLQEFFKTDYELAIKVLEPLYKMDVQKIASQVKVPVRSINSDYTPTSKENNLKYFRDYEYVTINESGHYPMLERAEEFNSAINNVLKSLES